MGRLGQENLKFTPPGNNQKITEHFRPVKIDLKKSKRLDPEVKSDQKIVDKVQLRFVG